MVGDESAHKYLFSRDKSVMLEHEEALLMIMLDTGFNIERIRIAVDKVAIDVRTVINNLELIR